MSKKNSKKKETWQEENLKWDDLVLARNEAFAAITKQQILIATIAKENKDTIEADTNLKDMIIGYSKSIEDLARDARTIAEKHCTFVDNKITDAKTGEIKEEEEYLEYIGIAAAYLSTQEKLLNLNGTAYIDIFTTLKLMNEKDAQEIAEIVQAGRNAMADAAMEVAKEMEDKNGK